jgi:hypothetical protein
VAPRDRTRPGRQAPRRIGRRDGQSEIDEAVRDRTTRIRVDAGEASLSNIRASSAAAVVVAAPLS